jgi:hypothetical protein
MLSEAVKRHRRDSLNLLEVAYHNHWMLLEVLESNILSTYQVV